jgi:hypothetical protein
MLSLTTCWSSVAFSLSALGNPATSHPRRLSFQPGIIVTRPKFLEGNSIFFVRRNIAETKQCFVKAPGLAA